MAKVFEKRFAIIYTDSTIRLFDETQFSYNLTDVEFILKNVVVELWDDHTIHVTGTTAKKHYTDKPLYIDTLTDDFKNSLLPKSTHKSLFKKREFIIGSYCTWNDYQTEMYFKFDPYSIVIEP
jgi:hypothetical protein